MSFVSCRLSNHVRSRISQRGIGIAEVFEVVREGTLRPTGNNRWIVSSVVSDVVVVLVVGVSGRTTVVTSFRRGPTAPTRGPADI